MEAAKFYTGSVPKTNVTDTIMLPGNFTIEAKGSAAPGYLIWGGSYQIQINADGSVTAWEFYHSSIAMKSPKTYNANNDIHVVLVGEGNTLSMYINGELSNTSEADGLIAMGNFNITNKAIFGDQSPNGVEVNFYNQAATADDVTAMYLAD